MAKKHSILKFIAASALAALFAGITASFFRRRREQALDDFDDELSLELAKKLLGYPFRITQRDKLNEAIALIEDFMYDEAADIIRDIEPTIE